MATTIKTWVPRLAVMCRASAVALIAGVCRSQSINEINGRIASRPIPEQATIVASVLASLFALCLFAAQFGWIGMLAFWLAVIVLVN